MDEIVIRTWHLLPSGKVFKGRYIKDKDTGRLFGKLPVEMMFVDRNRNGQRAVSASNLSNMGKWDKKKSRALVVNVIASGMASVIDGQHRMTLARRDGIETIDCEIWEGLTPGQEATLFQELNSAKPLDANDKYYNLLKHDGDNAAKRIERILNKHGFRTPQPDKDDTDLTFTCCGTLLNVVTGKGKRKDIGTGSDLLENVFVVLVSAYRIDKGSKRIHPIARNGDFIVGLAKYLKGKNSVNIASAIRALSAHGDPGKLKAIADARNAANGRDGRKAVNYMAQVIEECVDSGGQTPSLTTKTPR